MKKIELLDVVRMLVDAPEENVRVGSVGTVIFVHGSPAQAYEIEFVDDRGCSVAQIVALPGQVELVSDGPAMHG